MDESNINMNKTVEEYITKLPKFELDNADGTKLTNENIVGKNIIFYFYPKDNTPSCTNQAKQFSENIKKFNDLNVTIYGVSIDNIKSHKSFISKHNLAIDLLSDEKHVFISAVGAWVEKKMYGKEYWGTERTTIFVASDGAVMKIWRKVRVSGHVDEVLDFVSMSLSS